MTESTLAADRRLIANMDWSSITNSERAPALNRPMQLKIIYSPITQLSRSKKLGRRFTPKSLTDIEHHILRYINTTHAGVISELSIAASIVGYYGTGFERETNALVSWKVEPA